MLKTEYVNPSPVITRFVPGHDRRLQSAPSIPIELHFSLPMDCGQITRALQFKSTTSSGQIPRLDLSSVRCSNVSIAETSMSGEINTAWTFTATMIDISDGIHEISINNASTAINKSITTNSHDHFFLRIGKEDNPMVYAAANYSSDMLFKHANNSLYIVHKAAGADMFKYSLNFETTYSDWEPYPGGESPTTNLAPKIWSGTKLQDWDGEHVIVQYWNRIVGSSDHVQSADIGVDSLQRQWPHAFLEGTFNQHGYDQGYANQMQLHKNNTWIFDFLNEWPMQVSVNWWGMNPDGRPDMTRVYGDIDGDYVLDRIAPQSLIDSVINITSPPPSPFLGWRIVLNDADYRFQLIPIGSRWTQLILYILFWFMPILTGAAAVWAYTKSFYGVKHNEFGMTNKKGGFIGQFFELKSVPDAPKGAAEPPVPQPPEIKPSTIAIPHEFRAAKQPALASIKQTATPKRLTVLIATMEYDIEDWGIKVKIGGLGVMASLMCKNLKHQDLVWVIPWSASSQRELFPSY